MIKLEKSARRHAIAASAASVVFYVPYIACWFPKFEIGFVVPLIWVAAISLTLSILILLLMPLEKVADLLARHLQRSWRVSCDPDQAERLGALSTT